MPIQNGAASVAQGLGWGAAIGGGTAMVFGAHVDALIISMIAAALVSFWMPSTNDRAKSCAAILLSSLLASYAAPVAADFLIAYFPAFSRVEAQGLRMVCALLVGICCPLLAPSAVDWARRRLASGGEPKRRRL